MSFSFCCHDSLLKGYLTARKLNLATCPVYGVHHNLSAEFIRDNSIRKEEETENNSGGSLIQYAVSRNNLELLEYFLLQGKVFEDPSGLNPNYADPYRNTALHTAAYDGHDEAAQLLINHGASHDTHDENGLAPIHIAAQRGFVDFITLILDQGADIHRQDPDGSTVAHHAAQAGNVNVLQALHLRGMPLNEPNNYRLTPIMMAQYAENEGVDTSKVIEYLQSLNIKTSATVSLSLLSKKKPQLKIQGGCKYLQNGKLHNTFSDDEEEDDSSDDDCFPFSHSH